ncbi:putative glutamate receptor [Nymphon striatum]|nr:putative glutamate receptor [Nymphon striatum]
MENACGERFDVNHALNCKTGGFISRRHHNIRDLFTVLLNKVCVDVECEPHLLPVTAEVMRLKSANTVKDARLDIKAKGFWRRGQTSFFDVRVTHVNSQTNDNKDTKVVFKEHEQSKKREYLERVLEIEHASFTPLVFGTNDGMSTECQKFVSALATKLAEKQNEEYSGFNNSGTQVIINYAYSDYKMEIARMAVMGYWQLERGLTEIVPFYRCCYNLTGYPVTLAYVQGDKVYATVEKIGNTFVLTEFMGDILNIILTHLGIRIVKIEVEPNGTYGGLDQNNEPTGLFKLLANNQADIIIQPMVYTIIRNKVADFTVSVFETKIIGLYKPPDDNSKFWTFYEKPFSMYSWIIIVTIIPCLMMFSVILLRYFPNTGVSDSNQFDILVICGLLLNQGSSQYPTSVGWRIYHWSVMLLGTLLVAFYCSKIVATNAVLKQKEFFTDFYEVAEHPIYRPIVWKDTAYHNMLKDSSDPEIFTLWNRMKKDINKHTVTSIEQIFEQVDCCQAVYIDSSNYINYLKSQHPSFVILDRSLGIQQVGIALQKNSPLTKMFDRVILDNMNILIDVRYYFNFRINHLHEGGIIQNIIDDYRNYSSNIEETKIVKPIACDSGPMEFLVDVNLWSTFIRDMAQYTGSSCIYLVTDSTKMKIESEPNGTFGGLDRNNKPTGLFKLLANNQADIILNPVSYSLDRYKVADFTVSVFENKIIGLYKPPDDNSNFMKFYARPFSIWHMDGNGNGNVEVEEWKWKFMAVEDDMGIWIRDSAEPEASTLWNRMKKDINKYTVTSIEETIEQVDCCHGVYIAPSDYIMILKNKNPSFVILDRSLGKEPIGIALQKNSPLTKMFDTVLNHLHEGGIIQKLIDVHHNISSNIKETKIVKPIALSKMIFPITFIANAIIFTIILWKHNHEEADTLIPLHCLNAASSKPGCSIDVFTVDTDVYVLLIYIFSFLLPPCKLYMHAGRGKSYRVLDIEESCRKIGSRKCNALLGMHAFTGSDWGGKFSGITKRKWMKLFLELDDSDEILDLILVLGISSPVGYGWEDKDTSIMPIMCLKSPAPKALLELIKCGCKGKCDKRQCSRLRNNLHCTPACLCGDCHNQDDAEKSADDGIGDESSSDETGD